jgi:DNA repair exonuclease SbcCD nuclease subunit
MTPYVILSDLHFHAWSQFATVDKDGVNSRLLGLTDEVRRAGAELRKAGGNTMVLSGDIFHTRGSVEPVVFNMVQDVFREQTAAGINVIAIPGNHDLATKDTARLHNAAAALADAGVKMIHNPAGETFLDADGYGLRLIPWHEDLSVLRMHIEDLSSMDGREWAFDLILHAPIDGVIKGIPDHGLDPEWLASLGYRNVFAGHYHHHKECAPKVWSVGALAHHTWNDVGTKAGFLIVGEEVRWMKSHLPSFVDITEHTPEDELALLVDQNYARAKVSGATLKQVEELRSFLLAAGAKGVIIQSVKEPTKVREGKVVKSGESLSESVGTYVGKLDLDEEMTALVAKECREILIDAEAI